MSPQPIYQANGGGSDAVPFQIVQGKPDNIHIEIHPDPQVACAGGDCSATPTTRQNNNGKLGTVKISIRDKCGNLHDNDVDGMFYSGAAAWSTPGSAGQNIVRTVVSSSTPQTLDTNFHKVHAYRHQAGIQRDSRSPQGTNRNIVS
jgi:hypothetical protein